MGIEDVFPWIKWLADSLEAFAYPIYIFHVAAVFIFAVLFIPLLFGIEYQLFPRPKLVRFKYKWGSRQVALFGILTALYLVAYIFGGFFPVIPGIISLFILAWIFGFMFPAIFGWPGIYAVIAGELLGELVMGWFYPAFIPNLLADYGFLGWIAWKTSGRDTSLTTAKSWGWWILGYIVIFAFFNMFDWGAMLVLFGIMPLKRMYIFRSMVNFANYYFPNIVIHIPLMAVVHRLAWRYKLHWQRMEPNPYTRIE
jgi:hypothetical protein